MIFFSQTVTACEKLWEISRDQARHTVRIMMSSFMHDSRLDPSFGPKQGLKITMMEEYSRRYANLEHTMTHFDVKHTWLLVATPSISVMCDISSSLDIRMSLVKRWGDWSSHSLVRFIYLVHFLCFGHPNLPVVMYCSCIVSPCPIHIQSMRCRPRGMGVYKLSMIWTVYSGCHLSYGVAIS